MNAFQGIANVNGLKFIGVAAVCAISAPPAFANTPSNKLLSAPLVAPNSAWAFYGSPSTHTNGYLTWSPSRTAIARPELHALAVSLGSGRLSSEEYAERAHQYISNNIAVEYRFGLGKGGFGALIDQSGTPFDQAELMVMLLREAGISAKYQVGTITPSVADFGKWTGLVYNLNQANQTFDVSAKGACQLLADGALPAIVNGASDCAAVSGNLTSVTLGHIWVSANGKLYDPSFKQHILKAGVNVPAAMGCGASCGSQVVSSMMQGATSANLNSDSRFPYLQNLNSVALDGMLQGYAANLESSVRATDQIAGLEDVVGGKIIDLSTYRLPGSALPYPSAVQYSWSGDIPDQFRTKSIFTCIYPSSSSAASFFSDETSGQLLIGGYVSSPSGLTIQACPAGLASSAQFSIDHPYAADSGSYGDRASLTQDLIYPYTVVNPNGSASSTDSPLGFLLIAQVGNTTASTSQYYGRIAEISQASAGGLHASAAKALGNRYMAQKILEGLSGSTITNHAAIGIALNTFWLSSGRMSLQSSESIESTTENFGSIHTIFEVSSLIGSSLEGQVLTNGLEQGAAPSGFAIANSIGSKFISVSPNNIAALLPSLISYTSAQLGNLTSAGATEFNYIVSQNGNVGSYFCQQVTLACYGTSPAYGYKTGENSPTVGLYFKGGVGPLVDPAKQATEATKASERASGRPSFSANLAQSTLAIAPAPDLTVGTLSFQRYYDSGKSESAYFLYGSSGPIGLQETNPSEIGGSWRHSLRPLASIESDTDAALGKYTAIQGVAAITAMQSMLQASVLNSPSGRLAQMLSSHWLMSRFIDNSVTFSLPPKQSSFFKLPSGTYFNRAMDGSRMTVSGSRTGPYVGSSCHPGAFCAVYNGYDYSTVGLQYFDASGDQWNFTAATIGEYHSAPPNFKGDSRILPSGFQTKFYYSVPPDEGSFRHLENLPTHVQSSDGYRINFTFTHPPVSDADYLAHWRWKLSQISDNTGRVVNFSRSGCVYMTYYDSTDTRCFSPYMQITVTSADNGVLKYQYAPDSGSPAPSTLTRDPYRLRYIYTPSSQTSPYLTIKYDDVSRIQSVANSRGVTTHYLGSGLFDSDRTLALNVDALNNISRSVIGPSAQPVQARDPLGMSSTMVYDNAGRLLREVRPEGNAVEYQYDVRGNKMRECAIAKGRVTWSSLTPLTEQAPQCNAGAGDLMTTTVYMEGPSVRADQCANPKTCNKPSYVIEPRFFGSSDITKRTDYEWSAVHGQLLTETKPADANGVRPVTTYGYTAFTGVDGATFYLLTSKQEKIDASNTTTTTWAYNGAAAKFTLREQVVDSGGLALRTCFKFDAAGNLISKTDPKVGLGTCS